jgi:DNA-binding transcriptional ArsR family regulator
MSNSKAELIIHPIRLRIIEAIDGRDLTSKQIADRLDDVPQATLYRQIKILLDGGILSIVSERLVHGIVERLYRLSPGAAHLSREEFAQITAEEHQRYFAIFLGNLNGSMNRYLHKNRFDVVQDGMTYFSSTPWLTDEEARQMRLDLLDLAARYGTAEPAGGRRRRTLAVAFFPDSETPPPDTDND